MRESIGSAWLMIIVMTFIVLFSSYLAFSINYSKSFRVKDGIVERIQKHNGIVRGKDKNSDTLKDIDEYLAQIGYNAYGDCVQFGGEQGTELAGVNGTSFKQNPKKDEKYNYCIVKVGTNRSDTNPLNSCYYKVIVFFSLEIGNLKVFSRFNTQGETQTLYYAKDEYFNHS